MQTQSKSNKRAKAEETNTAHGNTWIKAFDTIVLLYLQHVRSYML